MANKKSAEILEVSEKGCIFAKNIRNIMAKRYLDPKADLTFKKVFGEHPDLVISLLNALLPLNKGEEIQSVEYLTPFHAPDNLFFNENVVNVKCTNNNGSHFFVQIQTFWAPSFSLHVKPNSSKAYISKLGKRIGMNYQEPVFSLNLVREIVDADVDNYYHFYDIVQDDLTERIIDNFHLVFVELPKFTPHTMGEKRMQVLWLRYLTEIDGYMETVPQELLDIPEINKAMEVVEESAYTPEQLLGYDKFWDIIRTENTLYNSGVRQGMEKGRLEGREEGRLEGMELGVQKGRKEGREEGQKDEKIANARKMKSYGLALEMISDITGLTIDEVRDL